MPTCGCQNCDCCCGVGDIGHCGAPCCCCPCTNIKDTVLPIQLDRCCRPCKLTCCGGSFNCPTRCPDCRCMNYGKPQQDFFCGRLKCPRKEQREKRWPACNFIKPCIDVRLYRNGEHLNTSYAGHMPGEQFVFGRSLPTATSFIKRRLCNFIPYEYVDNDGCCSTP